MGYRLHAHLTPKRFEWMMHLTKHPCSTRDGRGNVACQCMRLGWTEWCEDFKGERLTEAGWAVLGIPPNSNSTTDSVC